MKNILWFDEIGIEDVPSVGGKNASLGEMTKAVVSKGVNVPFGFATTAEAYFYFLSSTGLDKKIEETLKDLNVHDLKQLSIKGKEARNLILNSQLPQAFWPLLFLRLPRLFPQRKGIRQPPLVWGTRTSKWERGLHPPRDKRLLCIIRGRLRMENNLIVLSVRPLLNLPLGLVR